jgi:hypothetical protein
MKSGVISSAAICAGLAIGLAISTTAVAASLAGQVGDKRRAMVLPIGARGHCVKIYKEYIAAPGHSAYASTRIGAEVLFCGSTRNANSKAEAEKSALKNCNGAMKRYKMRSIGPCEIVASK